MKFKRKNDPWLNVIGAMLCILPFYFAVKALVTGNADSVTSGIILLVICIILILPSYFLTSYEIENGCLRIKSGLLRRKTIYIKDIKTVAPSHNPLSSAVISSRRIGVYYEKNAIIKTVFVSPNDKDGFLNALKENNPDIIIKG